jgi:Ethanolamine utilization protein EutJ (predicted chaperonin)
LAFPLVLYDAPRFRAAGPDDVADPGALGRTHVQEDPSAVWSVQHNLGTRRMAIHVFDDTGAEVVGEPRWSEATENHIFLDFCRAVAGHAVVRRL